MSRALDVTSIGSHWTSRDLRKYFKSKARGVDFVVFPYRGDSSRAFVAYLSSKDAHKCRGHTHKKVGFRVTLSQGHLVALCTLDCPDLDLSRLTSAASSLSIHSIDSRSDRCIVGATFVQIQALVLRLNTMGGRESTLDFRRSGSLRSSGSRRNTANGQSSPHQLVFDAAVLAYIRQYHAVEIYDMEREHRVTFDFRSHDKEMCVVFILPSNSSSSTAANASPKSSSSLPRQLHHNAQMSSNAQKAKHEFSKLYNSIEVIKKLIIFDCDLNISELHNEVSRVFPCVHCIPRPSKDRNQIKILFVGKSICIEKCSQWLERANKRSHLGTRTFNTNDLNVLRLTLTYDDLKGYNYVSSCCNLGSNDCDENCNDSSVEDNISVLMPPEVSLNKHANHDLFSALKVYNEHYRHKPSLKLTPYKDHLTDELIIEGRVQVSWGVRSVITFKENDISSCQNQQAKNDEPSETMTLKRRKRLPRYKDPRRLSMINGHIFHRETSNFVPTMDSVTCVTSNTTHNPTDIIEHLLSKFKVENNSSEFCLCKVLSTGETKILNSSDRPLLEILISGPLSDNAKLFIMDWSNVQDITAKVAPYCRLPDTMLLGFLHKFDQEEHKEFIEIEKRYEKFRNCMIHLIKDKS